MAEEYPTTDEVKEIRQDIEDYMVDEKDLDSNYIPDALKHIKRYLEDKNGIRWAMVWDETGSDYYVGTDDVARNRDKIINAISNMAVALVFKDHSIKKTEGLWWELYTAYRDDAEESLSGALLDVDRDESGSIDDDETAVLIQPFVKR